MFDRCTRGILRLSCQFRQRFGSGTAGMFFRTHWDRVLVIGVADSTPSPFHFRIYCFWEILDPDCAAAFSAEDRTGICTNLCERTLQARCRVCNNFLEKDFSSICSFSVSEDTLPSAVTFVNKRNKTNKFEKLANTSFIFKLIMTTEKQAREADREKQCNLKLLIGFWCFLSKNYAGIMQLRK